MRATICLIVLGLSAPAFAFEPAKTGIDLYTWNQDSATSTAVNTNQRFTFGNSVRDWWNQPWGTRNTISLTNLNARSQNPTTPISLNLKQRLLSTPQNTIIDAGIGIQTIGFGQNDSRNGLRLSLGGRMGFAHSVTVYGESAWMPGLIESSGFDNLSGLEFETGVMLNPLPYLSIRAAYRRLNLDYTLTGGAGEHSYTEGIVFGTGIHW